VLYIRFGRDAFCGEYKPLLSMHDLYLYDGKEATTPRDFFNFRLPLLGDDDGDDDDDSDNGDDDDGGDDDDDDDDSDDANHAGGGGTVLDENRLLRHLRLHSKRSMPPKYPQLEQHSQLEYSRRKHARHERAKCIVKGSGGGVGGDIT